jgi:hypothetical protein
MAGLSKWAKAATAKAMSAQTVGGPKAAGDVEGVARLAKVASEKARMAGIRADEGRGKHSDAVAANEAAAAAHKVAGNPSKAAYHESQVERHARLAEPAGQRAGGGGDGHPRDNHGRFAAK